MNAHMTATYDRMKRDLETAAQIQRRLLPTPDSYIDGVTAAWDLIPCEELAGDSLNLIRLDEHRLGVYVLDVSGHGLEAAVLAVTLHKVIDVLARSMRATGASPHRQPATPSELSEELNRLFPIDPVNNQYFTLLYGVLDARQRRFRYVSAGHHAPIHLRPSGSLSESGGFGLPIGVVEDASYDEQTIDLEPGSRLYFYSDGLVDAECSYQGPFGKARLVQAIGSARGCSLQQSVGCVIEHVREWSSTARLEDDATLLAVQID